MAAVLACAAASPAQNTTAAPDLPDAPSAHLHGPGGVTVERASATPLSLGLDDAIQLALQHNEQLKVDEQSVRLVKGQTGTAINALLPSLTASASSSAEEIDLAAMGFKPSSLAAFGFPPNLIPLIVKVDVTGAQLNVSQQLFNAPAYEVYRAAQSEVTAADLSMRLTRGNVVLAVGTSYLRALADQAQIADAEALLRQDDEQLRQATARDQAGVGTHLDVLRAQVQLQSQQQVLISAQNTFAKDKIALNRNIGLPAEQEIRFTDPVPLSELNELPLDQAKALAYERRKDYTSLLAQLQVAQRESLAVRYEHLPTLAFNGFYGVLGQTTRLYHGVFTAEGSLTFPIFREAQFRAERVAVNAQVERLRNQIASLRDTIDQQIRSDMLDVQAASELVKVDRSNVDLARQELSDASDRLTAGVDDNLRVIEAQAVLAQTQGRLIEDEFQYNRAKLSLARSTGVVETQYKTYIGN